MCGSSFAEISIQNVEGWIPDTEMTRKCCRKWVCLATVLYTASGDSLRNGVGRKIPCPQTESLADKMASLIICTLFLSVLISNTVVCNGLFSVVGLGCLAVIVRQDTSMCGTSWTDFHMALGS